MLRRKLLVNALKYAILLILLVTALFPVYWMLNTSLKTNNEIYRSIPTFFPELPSLDAYRELLYGTNFLQSAWNSFTIAMVVSVVSVFFSALASYAISRTNMRGAKAISRGILYTYLMPASLIFIPIYMLVNRLGIPRNQVGLMIIYPTHTIPYAMWMLIAYFRTVPREIEESAFVDGCGYLRCMFQIFFPLTIPGIVSTLIFSFTLSWNEYMYALVIVSDSTAKTFPLMLTDFMVDDTYAWGPLMAGSVLACVPILLIYTVFSRFVTGGLVAGSVKM